MWACVSLLDLHGFCCPPLLSLCFLSLYCSFSPLNLSQMWRLCPRSVVSLCFMRSSPPKNTTHVCSVFFPFAIDDPGSFFFGKLCQGKKACGSQEKDCWPFSLFSTGREKSQNSRDLNLYHSACFLPVWAFVASPLAKTLSNKEPNTSATACPYIKAKQPCCYSSMLKISIIHCRTCSPLRKQDWSLLHPLSTLIWLWKRIFKNIFMQRALTTEQGLILNVGWNEHSQNYEFWNTRGSCCTLGLFKDSPIVAQD